MVAQEGVHVYTTDINEEVIRGFKGYKNITVKKMDVTNNDSVKTFIDPVEKWI